MLSSAHEAHQPHASRGEGSADDLRSAEVGAWVTQLSRTLKTCRLYDAANPTVVRFREELTVSLVSLLGRHGGIEIEVTGTDLLLDGLPVQPPQTRDEGLAFAFYRDGVRAVRLFPGIEPAEIELLVDALLRQGRASEAEDDLVTLLWESQHPHIEIDCVPADGEVDPTGEEYNRDPIPWPGSRARDEIECESAGMDESIREQECPTPEAGDRSDDWTIGEEVSVIEEGWIDLTEHQGSDTERFRAEFVEERSPSLYRRAIQILDACIRAGATVDDRRELELMLPAAARSALSDGDWSAARAAIEIICRSQNPAPLLEELTGELAVEGMTRETARRIDLPSAEVPDDLLEIVRLLGSHALTWASGLLTHLHRGRIREQWIGALAPAVQAEPERLQSRIEEIDGFAARSAVELLGAAGGPRVIPMLDLAARSSDAGVRQAVIEALGPIEDPSARALLARFLDAPESRLFCMALQRLAQAPDADLTARLQARIASPSFDARPADERRLVFSVLASHATDETVRFLEGEMHRGGWLSRPNETRLQSIARCLARIGSESARAVLQRGAESRKAPVRRACKDTLGGGASHA